MTDKDRDFLLDSTAQELYDQLAGLDLQDRATAFGKPTESGLIDLLGQEEKLLDHYRLLLAATASLFAEILNSSRFPSLQHDIDRNIQLLTDNLKRLSKSPKFDGKIICRYRGNQLTTGKTGSEVFDYELSAGNLLVDLKLSEEISSRRGMASPLYPLSDSFIIFNSLGIYSFCFNIGTDKPDVYHNIAASLRFLVRFFTEQAAGEGSDFFVLDEHGKPNPNLTLLAALNSLNPEALKKLVVKIKPIMFGSVPHKDLNHFVTIYDAIYSLTSKHQPLIKPPVDINNFLHIIQAYEDKKATPVSKEASHFVHTNYSDNPLVAAEVSASISSEGYRKIHGNILQKRLGQASDFIKESEKNEKSEALQNEALKNIEDGLELIPDSIFDSFNISDGGVNTVNSKGQNTKWILHQKIVALVDFFKGRSRIKKKIQNITHEQVCFDEQDFQVIAKNFKITESHAENLVSLLKECFDQNGRFRRTSFEKNIPSFIQYGSKVFEFLWHYLKELPIKEDRIAFLNALQYMIDKLADPRKTLTTVLDDIVGNSHTVHYSDRNGLILVIILLRKYNKEQRSHIELTPEEVLQVQKGLDDSMVGVALSYFEKEQEHLFHKFRAIHERLHASLANNPQDAETLPARYLFSLERELIIFLSLVGGPSSHKIIRGVVKEYGNPDSGIYKTDCAKDHLKSFLQLLQVATRSLQRFYEFQDYSLFAAIKEREIDFLSLCQNAPQKKMVKRVMEWMR